MHATRRRFIIDTDTASDDAVALIMALERRDVEVEAITIVGGNVPVELGSTNARLVVELCGKTTPVYEGCHRPLLREAVDSTFFHGPDGLGGMNYPAPSRPAAGTDAAAELIRRFREAHDARAGTRPGEITLVTLGPLTNIAAALVQEPRLATWVRECYVMGGAACAVGNITPAAEYNIWCDPEAARIVFHSGMRMLMVSWEHSRGAASLTEAEMEEVRGLGTDKARFAIDCNRSALRANRELLGDRGLALPDPVTMAIALDPSICTERSPHFVDVSVDEALTRGMTVVDRFGVSGKPPNVDVCWKIDVARWKESLWMALR